MADERQGVNSNSASLGCGTLILIALIVIFFSGGDTARLTSEVESLRREVKRLNAQQAETHRLVETLVLEAGVDPKSVTGYRNRFLPETPKP